MNRTTLIVDPAAMTHQSAIGRYEQAIASAIPPRIETAIKRRVRASPDVARRAEGDKRSEIIGNRRCRSLPPGPTPSRMVGDEWRDEHLASGSRPSALRRLDESKPERGPWSNRTARV